MTALTMAVLVALVSLIDTATVDAQTDTGVAQALAEDLQPRVIGSRGATLIGIAGYVDRFYSTERLNPLNYTAQLAVSRFITRKFVVRGGVTGSGSLGGDASETLAAGPGAAALHASAGLLYYFTPQSIVSLYSGAEYWAQLTQRADADAGSIVGTLGLQGAVSPRVHVFVEGGYGVGLTKGDKDALRSRVVGQIGMRLRL